MTEHYVLSIIPARSGSKGVPGKNIKLLGKYPLLVYSIKASLKSNLINRTIVSTDSNEIAEIGISFGAEVPFIRPKEISVDLSSDFEFVDHALTWLSQNKQRVPDFIVHLRPTTPLRIPSIIDEAIVKFIGDTTATSLRSVHQMPESAYKCFEIENNYLKTVCKNIFDLDATNDARQLYPVTFSANGYVDVLRTSFIKSNKKLHGNRVIPFLTPSVIEVDSMNDFRLLETQVKEEIDIINNLFRN